MEIAENGKDMRLLLKFAMSYYPKNRKMSIKSRPQHTFLYIRDGEYCYRYDREVLCVKSGELLYIPKGATYSFEVVSPTVYIRQVEFEIINPSFQFSNVPKIIEGIENAEALLKNIIENYGKSNPKNYFCALGDLYKLCEFIPEEESKQSDVGGKIRAAALYIEAHCEEKIDVQKLADLCFMSQSQLRRYFKAKYNMSPITFKNRFRVEKAKQMLLYDVADISDIADRLGFDSVYSFSKIFKMYAGITPSQFAKNKNSR